MTVMDKNISNKQDTMKDSNQTTDTNWSDNSDKKENTDENGNVIENVTDAPDNEEDNKKDDAVAVEDLTVEQWLEKLSVAETLAADRLEGQQRALADFQNFKRRKSQEMQLAHQNAAAELLSQFFPIVDDLQLALESLPTAEDGAKWSEGFNMIHRKILSVFEKEKVVTITAKPGEPFDPHIHEAIMQEAHDDYASDVIVAMVRPGYLLGERVLRPAQVRVAE